MNTTKKDNWKSNLEVAIKKENEERIKKFGAKYLGTRKYMNSIVTDFIIEIAFVELEKLSDEEVASKFIEWNAKRELINISGGA